MSPTRPVARWHGGKWRLAPWIIENMPPHRTYVEPYCGAASVLMRKPRSRVEVLNDSYERIVNAFRVIREHPRELEFALRHTPYAEVEYHRALEVSPDPLEDARRLLVVGQQARGSSGSCNNGRHSGWRRGVRPKGEHSANGWSRIWQQVEAWAERLRDVYLECCPALDLVRRWDAPDTVFYVDPPYLWSTRSSSSRDSAYGDREMSDKEHEELAEVLSGCTGMVVLSGYRSALYDSLFHGWRRVEREAFADGGAARTECLWISPNAEKSALGGQLRLIDQDGTGGVHLTKKTTTSAIGLVAIQRKFSELYRARCQTEVVWQ